MGYYQKGKHGRNKNEVRKNFEVPQLRIVEGLYYDVESYPTQIDMRTWG